jgi:hypothetical protein
LRLLATLPFEAPSEPSKTSLAIVTAHREDRLIALWPLVLVGSGGLKLVRWMGEPVSQYGEVLIANVPDKAAVRHRQASPSMSAALSAAPPTLSCVVAAQRRDRATGRPLARFGDLGAEGGETRIGERRRPSRRCRHRRVPADRRWRCPRRWAARIHSCNSRVPGLRRWKAGSCGVAIGDYAGGSPGRTEPTPALPRLAAAAPEGRARLPRLVGRARILAVARAAKRPQP